MLDLTVTDRWQETFPGGHVGILLMGNVDNTRHATSLHDLKRALELRLREQFGRLSRAELRELEVLKAYRDYYRKFGQTYHVQLQLESVVHKGRSLPNVSPLVDASFLAELDTLVLTASHDADHLTAPLTLDVTQGGEEFVQMNGSVRSLKPGDMLMRDAQGIVCTILYGQDRRTAVTPETRRALYVAYAPPGVPKAEVRRQLATIRAWVLLVAPEALVERAELYPTLEVSSPAGAGCGDPPDPRAPDEGN